MNTHRKHEVFRTLIVILVTAVLFFGGASMAQAAAQAAIPGDALYSVKTTFEQTRLKLAQDAGDRAEMRMAFAEKRLEEISALIAENRFNEVSDAVLAFEANINSAILELQTVASVNPERAARIAQEVTTALTRYAQILAGMLTNAPESVRLDVARALETTQIVGSLEMPAGIVESDDNSNTNDSSGDSNTNDDNDADDNANDDDSNSNDADDNANDDDSNSNDADDNANDDDSNSNDDDDNTNDDSNNNDDSSGMNDNDDGDNSNDDDNNDGSDANNNGDD